MLGLIFAHFGLASASPPLYPHRLTYCVALLSDPMFDEVGRRIVAEEPLPDGLPELTTPEPSHVQHLDFTNMVKEKFESMEWKTSVILFSREFIGADEILTYLESVRQRAQSLQSTLNADSSVPKWDLNSKHMFFHAILPQPRDESAAPSRARAHDESRARLARHGLRDVSSPPGRRA